LKDALANQPVGEEAVHQRVVNVAGLEAAHPDVAAELACDGQYPPCCKLRV
jgi:hypothetical protein